ncbi:MAG: hypothetical protein AAFU49_00720 [Pseudomonadota bacterium]
MTHRSPILLLALLAACTGSGEQPLRNPSSDLERAYLACLGSDPYVLTSRCREIRAQLSDDPRPGLFGR